MCVTFDFSSTQLLAEWLRPELDKSPLLAPAQKDLRHLAQSVQITSGLGQTEIWMLFRILGEDISQQIPAELMASLETVDDQGQFR